MIVTGKKAADERKRKGDAIMQHLKEAKNLHQVSWPATAFTLFVTLDLWKHIMKREGRPVRR
jgi:hypothetical protein